MKAGILLIIITALLNLMGCSGDETEKKAPNPEAGLSAPSPIKSIPAEPYPNSPSTQDLQPDLHISGAQDIHASGALSSSEHICGQ